MISVVVPVYNKEYSVVACLASVLVQLDGDDELIIVNDGSTDSSLEKVRLFLSEHPAATVRLINQENAGVAVARNSGAKFASNDHVAFLDADDEWLPGYMESMKRLIRNFPNAAMYSCYFSFNDSVLGSYTVASPLEDGYEGYVYNYFDVARKTYIVNSSNVVVRKSSFESVGGFPSGVVINEDLFLWFRLAARYSFAHVNRVLVRINRHVDASRSSRRNTIPYLVEHFSNSKSDFKLTGSMLDYIYSVHKNHMLSSLSRGEYYEAYFRWRYGLRLFPVRGLILFGLLLFPRRVFQILKAVRSGSRNAS